ncbi:MAG: Re/Si-specific NAD(P)(+) transhydrogenase subunit alpha [Thermaerobacter sp.]|jgi:NAD(P) transhydrogenase subunit alpha|nr:Re/Si-specific NAD(P)(+) transhydrogenase subunit alpha [Thermaerobacter sp.]
MDIGIPRETTEGERRVALLPDGAARLIGAGHRVLVERGAGAEAHVPDQAYETVGAVMAYDAGALFAQSDLVLKVRAPSAAEVALLRPGTALVGLLQPLVSPDLVRSLAAAQITSFSLDTLPRISRAQSMDVLTSMSTVAGYRAVLTGANLLGKFFPLLMTAAGTITPAKLLVLGAGVAGLQAIATARRLGAVVQAFDTRPAVKEQVESLGASFLTLPPLAQAEATGGYARQLAEEEIERERELLRAPVQEADVVITTALIPGTRAPVLLTRAMVEAMRPGSVIVDLAAEGGGNCELAVPGQRVQVGDVVIDASLNVPSQMPQHASQLFSRNLTAYTTHLLSVGLRRDADGREELDRSDEIVVGTCITHRGAVVHEATRARMERST